jgi:hypothetical protein
MDRALGMALAPFFLLLCLLIAHPFKRAAERMKNGKLRRFLLIRW